MSLGRCPAAARRLSPAGIHEGESRARTPADREPPVLRDPREVDRDYWLPAVDVLILRVADRLRRAGLDIPEHALRVVAEDAVLDAARFVLDWVEGPGAASAPR